MRLVRDRFRFLLFFFLFLYFLLPFAIVESANADNSDFTKKSTSKKNTPGRYSALNTKGKVTNKSAVCVLDNETGLVWELKTDDDGVHDKDKTYRWGGRGAEQIGEKFFDDWNALLDATNSEKLCGFSNWRVPTIDELKTLVITGKSPTIDTDFFPLTLSKPYWSVSAYKTYPEHGQTVQFESGASYYYDGYRGNSLPLRLVRSKIN